MSFFDKSMSQQYRQTRQSVEKMGAQLAEHLEQKEQLRQAFKEGDYVTRDAIVIEKSSKRMARRVMLSLLPLVILLFVNFGAFLVLALWLGFQIYALRREVKETVWGWDMQRLKAMRAVRRVISVGVFVIALMLTFSYDKTPLGMAAFYGGMTFVVCAIYLLYVSA